VYVCSPHTTKGTERCGQEYVNPLLTLKGEEYARIGWEDLWGRISKAVEKEFPCPPNELGMKLRQRHAAKDEKKTPLQDKQVVHQHA
jgi:hypothetical protein